MRLITHTDLDGVMCAVLICNIEDVVEIKFLDPATIQSGKLAITKYDIIADLPYDRRCGMWFDHHASSKPKDGQKFEGMWKETPSCARGIFEYYDNPYLDKYREALDEVDKIDSGNVPIEQAENPSGWFLLSNTLETSAPKKQDDAYRRHVVELIRKCPKIEKILEDARVAERAGKLRAEFEKFRKMLKENTVMIGKVAFSDMRGVEGLPKGNNYLVYSLFPLAVTSVRLMPQDDEKGSVKLSVGHNIYCKKSIFDVGAAMKKLGGGGHKAVGGASVKKEDAEAVAKRIIWEINEFEGLLESACKNCRKLKTA